MTIGWEIRAKICHDIALGLFHCHEEKIVHYSLKPDSIYLTSDLTPKISGFGKNRRISSSSSSREDLTILQPSAVHWVAPESVSSDFIMKKYYEDNPELADIYSYGLILWSVACSGAIPYEGIQRDTILGEKRLTNAGDVLRGQLPPDCPFEFSQIFLKLTKYNPRHRTNLLYILTILEGLYDIRPELPDSTISFSKSSHNGSIQRYGSQDDFGGGATESDTNSQHALINNNANTRRPATPINGGPRTGTDLLDEITSMYVEAEKQGFDWLAKNLKQWAEVEDNDPKKVFEMLKDGGERRYRDCILGYFYEEGFGTHRDTQQAYRCYRKAADNSEPAAQNHLGLCYQDGIGTERDSSKSFDWFQEAAAAGHPGALNNLAQCYDYGKGTSPNRLKAFLTYKKAAEGGNVSAQYSLALCYDGGYGTTRDKRKAVKWLTMAANNGSTAAIETLAARKKKKKNCTVM